jgi:hypothetical protein
VLDIADVTGIDDFDATSNVAFTTSIADNVLDTAIITVTYTGS